MRVNFVLPVMPHAPGGGLRVIYDYARWLGHWGHDVNLYHAGVAGLWDGEHAVRPDPRVNLRTYTRDIVRKRTSPRWYDFAALGGSPGKVTVINHLQLRHRHLLQADATIASSCHTAPFVSSLSGSAGVKSYFLQHYETWSMPKEYVDNTWRLPLNRVVIAKWLLEKAAELGVAAKYVPNAVDGEEFQLGPPLRDREYDICAMYSPIRWKRPDLLVNVFEECRRVWPKFTVVTFGVEPRPAELPRWVDYFRQPDRASLARLYANSKLYVCASDGEGWHLPPAEAMASGCAVVSTSIDGVLEYAGDFGFFSPVGDGRSLAKSVCDALANLGSTQARAAAGSTHVRSYMPEDAARAFARAVGVE